MTSIYQVSARKFRPKCFSEVLGQPHVIDSLRNSLKNKSFGHAFLFNGPRGVGKTTCARILAQAINCEKSLEIGEPCNECNSCINLKGKNLGGVFELDGASNNSVENIKSIIEKIRYLPTTFKYSIYIIDEVHMLSGAAFNAFLKTLEEPPAHAIFILATTEKSKILPTILSRCQIFDFKPISISNIVKNLKEVAQKQNINYEEEALYIIAEKADGGMRDALSIFDTMMNISLEKILSYELVCKNLGICGIESYVSLVDLCFKKNLEGAIKLFHEIIFLGVESTIFLVELIRHLRNLLIIKNIKNGKNFIKKSDEAIKKISSQAEFVSYDFLDLAIKKSIQCDLNLKNCSDKNLIIELLIFSLASGVYEEKKDLSPPKKVNESKKNKVNTSSSEKTLSDFTVNMLLGGFGRL